MRIRWGVRVNLAAEGWTDQIGGTESRLRVGLAHKLSSRRRWSAIVLGVCSVLRQVREVELLASWSHAARAPRPECGCALRGVAHWRSRDCCFHVLREALRLVLVEDRSSAQRLAL